VQMQFVSPCTLSPHFPIGFFEVLTRHVLVAVVGDRYPPGPLKG
jgi:hypothetical protein